MHFDTDEERELYRRAGRKAGRLLERPVRTVVSGGQVHVVLDDWMDNPLERQLEDTRTRRTLDAAFADLDTTSPPRPTGGTVIPLHRDRPRAD